MMIETLYRVWNKTKKTYQQTSTTGNRFYQNETGAKLGVRRMKEFWRLQGDEFEIQEWIALPKEEYEKLLNVQSKLKCVLCEKDAITTAAHIPVCEDHYQEYAREAENYPTYRPFYEKLLKAQRDK